MNPVPEEVDLSLSLDGRKSLGDFVLAVMNVDAHETSVSGARIVGESTPGILMWSLALLDLARRDKFPGNKKPSHDQVRVLAERTVSVHGTLFQNMTVEGVVGTAEYAIGMTDQFPNIDAVHAIEAACAMTARIMTMHGADAETRVASALDELGTML